jgi:adenosylcobinamide-phosphate synthase
MDALAVKLSLAYGLDLVMGDPRWLPHPVRGLGWAIQRGEQMLRKWIRNEIWAGWLLVLGLTAGTFGLVKALLWSAEAFSLWVAVGCEIALLYACLSTKDLAVESWPVYRALKEKRLPEARAKVSLIVGRDTESLSEAEVVRATVETIGESLMDGIIAPLFYAVMGGVPLACVYKAVNTLDSMVGYRSARYVKFGKAAAQVDTWMNLIPARMTAWLIAFAAWGIGFNGWESIRVTFRDAWARGQNSWIPEAAMAGALEVQCGGTNFYNKVAVETPRLGNPNRPCETEVIPKAIRLMYACSLLGVVTAVIVRWGVWGMVR